MGEIESPVRSLESAFTRLSMIVVVVEVVVVVVEVVEVVVEVVEVVAVVVEVVEVVVEVVEVVVEVVEVVEVVIAVVAVVVVVVVVVNSMQKVYWSGSNYCIMISQPELSRSSNISRGSKGVVVVVLPLPMEKGENKEQTCPLMDTHVHHMCLKVAWCFSSASQ